MAGRGARAGLETMRRGMRVAGLQARRRELGPSLTPTPLFCAACGLEILRTQPWFTCETCSRSAAVAGIGAPAKPAGAAKKNAAAAAAEAKRAPDPVLAGKVFLCPVCFARGARTKTHSPDHAYSVNRSPARSVLSEGWSAEEEVRLVEGVELNGIGNWQAVADYVGVPNKSVEDIEEHYLQMYVCNFAIPRQPHEAPEVLTRYRSKALRQDAVDAALREAQAAAEEGGPDLTGYMPLREDFDVEYEQTAEILLCDLTFDDNETRTMLRLSETPSAAPDCLRDRDTGLALFRLGAKLRLLHSYNDKLRERERRKEIAKDRDYVDWHDRHRKWLKADRAERVVRAQMRPLELFSSRAQHEAIVQALTRELTLDGRLHGGGDRRSRSALGTEASRALVRARRPASKRRASAGAVRRIASDLEAENDILDDSDDDDGSGADGGDVDAASNRSEDEEEEEYVDVDEDDLEAADNDLDGSGAGASRSSSRINSDSSVRRRTSKRRRTVSSKYASVHVNELAPRPKRAAASGRRAPLQKSEDTATSGSVPESLCRALDLAPSALEELVRQATAVVNKELAPSDPRRPEQIQMRIERKGDTIDVRIL